MVKTVSKRPSPRHDILETADKKLAHRQDAVEIPDETVVLSIPVDMLSVYEGVVSSDIVGKDGAIILPAGVDLSLLESSIGTIITRIKAQGIEEIRIRARPQFSEQDIEEIFEKVYTDDKALISKEQARDVVKQVDVLFGAVRKQEFEPEMIAPLANMGSSLTEEILRNPSVALSLGKVHDADEYTFVHSFNVAVLTGYLANRLHPSDRDYVHRIVIGSLLHDIGKAQIPIGILNKPGPLDPDEFTEMKKHPMLGVDMAIRGGMSDEDVLEVIGGHHEKWSGKGYPYGRKGLEISEAARLAAVADVFDALTAKRVYKRPMSSREALTLIMKDAGGHFDTRIARELLVSLGLYPPGSIVSLSDGSVGLVVSGGGKDLVRPVLMLKESKTKKLEGNSAPVFIDLKAAQDLCIVQYLGHGDKRDLGLPLKALKS